MEVTSKYDGLSSVELASLLRQKDQQIGEYRMYMKIGELMLPIKHLLPEPFIAAFLRLQPKDSDATP